MDTIIKIIAAIIVFLGMQYFLNYGNAERNEFNEIITSGGVNIFSLRIGDCLIEPEDAITANVEAVPCDQFHDLEIFEIFNLNLQSFDLNEINYLATEGCNMAFEKYVGIKYEESKYYITFFKPTEDGWRTAMDREITCMIYSLDQMPLFSVQNSGV